MPIFQDECNVKKDLAILIKHESDNKFAESPAQSKPLPSLVLNSISGRMAGPMTDTEYPAIKYPDTGYKTGRISGLTLIQTRYLRWKEHV